MSPTFWMSTENRTDQLTQASLSNFYACISTALIKRMVGMGRDGFSPTGTSSTPQ